MFYLEDSYLKSSNTFDSEYHTTNPLVMYGLHGTSVYVNQCCDFWTQLPQNSKFAPACSMSLNQ